MRTVATTCQARSTTRHVFHTELILLSERMKQLFHMLYDLRPNSLLADCLSVLTSENFTGHNNFRAYSFADCLSVLTSENFTRHNKYMHIMAHARFGVSCTCAHMLYCVCVGGGGGGLYFPDKEAFS